MLLLLKGTFEFSANYHFCKSFTKLNWNVLGKVIIWQSNCVRHPQNATTTDNNLSDSCHGPRQFWSGLCWRVDIWNVQPKGTLFCFRGAAVETLNFSFCLQQGLCGNSWHTCEFLSRTWISGAERGSLRISDPAQKEGISSYCRQPELKPWSTFCSAAHFSGLSTKFCPFTFKKYSEITFNNRENNDSFKDPLIFL